MRHTPGLRTPLLALAGLLFFATPAIAQSVVTEPVGFQGRLNKPDGTPVANTTTQALAFRVYDAATAGTLLWQQSLANVSVQGGLFAVNLNFNTGFVGAATNASVFNGVPVYVEVQAGADPPMTPRRQLAAVPYAFTAQTALSVADGALNSTAWLVGGNSGSSPASQFLGTTDAQPLVFRTGNTERLRLDSAGNLGVGTTTPVARLDVRSANGTAGAPALIVGPLPGQGQRAIAGLWSTFDNFPTDNNTRRTADIVAGFNGGVWGNEYLAFNVGNNGQPNDAAALTAEKVRITANGFVGIGTTTPGAQLDVRGAVLTTGNSGGGGTLLGYDPIPDAGYLRIYNTTSHAVIGMAATASGSGDLLVSDYKAFNSIELNGDTGAGKFPGTVQMSGFKLTAGGATGKVLTSDAAGVGTWSTPSISGWSLTGNAGTTPTTNFLGTTDAQPLAFRTGNTDKMRLDAAGNLGIGTTTPGAKLDVAGTAQMTGFKLPTGAAAGLALTSDAAGVGTWNAPSVAWNNISGVPNGLVGGSNTVTGSFAVIPGGSGNTASADFATVGGGVNNVATGQNATVGGGVNNNAGGQNDTIAGGWHGIAAGVNSTVGGGFINHANADYSTIPGGNSNRADGRASFAAGSNAYAAHDGSFVWSDSTGADFPSANANEFNVRAAGGVRIFSNAAATTGVLLPAGGGSWSVASDRNLKNNFQSVDTLEVLDKLAAVPLTTWSYKASETSRHMGPMAQDFYAAFGGLGTDDKHIDTIDADGVALAAIQGLNRKLEADNAAMLKANAELQAKNDALEARLAHVEEILGGRK